MWAMDNSPSLRPNRIVDARGIPCPGPLMSLLEAYNESENGDIVSVYATDEGVKVDCKAWAVKSGIEFLGNFDREGYYEAVVRKINR